MRGRLRVLGLVALQLGCGRSGISAFGESDAKAEGGREAQGGSAGRGNGATGGSLIGGAPTGGAATGGGSLGGAGGASSTGGSGGIAGVSGTAGSSTTCVPVAAEPETPFAFAFGDQSPQDALSIVPAHGGSAFFVGDFRGHVDIGGASATADQSGAFVALLAGSGRPVWTRFLSSTHAPAAALAPNGTLWVGGGAEGAAFLANFDECGNVLSQSMWGEGGAKATIESIAVAPNGDVLVSGYFSTAIDLGAGRIAGTASTDLDGFIARYDRMGRYVFGHGLGHQVRDLHVAADDSGSTLVGYTWGELSIDGNVVVSTTSSAGFAVKLDGSGELLWAFRDVREKSRPGSSTLTSVELDRRGNALIHGGFQYDGVDFGSGGAMEWQCCGGNAFALLVAPDGSPLWLLPIGAYVHAELSPRADGYVIVTNRVSADGLQVRRLDENGADVESQLYGFASYVDVADASTAEDGSLLVAGRYMGSLDLGVGSLETTEILDWHGFVARLPDSSE